ncbi:MAG: Rieske (2Fe-2S) protein [Actinobacteria bacterium]|nr:Rieske (2Fe-2S) protein [Actinomycetota bacterium]
MRDCDRHIVCATGELPPGARREVPVAGEYGVTVFNLGGEYFALRNKCPHKGGPLGRGRIRPHVVAAAGGYAFEREGEIVKCPYHNWEFDIRTGRALYDARYQAKTYRAAVEDGQVVLFSE